LLEQQFPDARIDSITAAPDRNHSFSGLYTRGVMSEGSVQWAFLRVSAAENSSAVDGILTYGILWLAWTRLHTQSRLVAGVRIFVPDVAAAHAGAFVRSARANFRVQRDIGASAAAG
jgi:hypothetical protein